MLLQLPARRPLVLGRPVAYPVPAALIDYDLTADALDPSLTFVRSTVKNLFDSSGVLTQQAIDALAVDYHPQTLARRGRLCEPTRTNYVQNNTMVGAAAGAARNIGTVSSVSRTASTTVVVASTGHTAAVGDMITVTGATPTDYNGTYRVSAVTAGVSYSYVVEASATDSASGYTISVVSPGTLPTRWGQSVAAGIARVVVGLGTQNGISYVDLRFAGLASAVNTIIRSEGINTIPAVVGQQWSASFFVGQVGGSTAGLTSIAHNLSAYDSTPLHIGAFATQTLSGLPGAISGNERSSISGTTSNASTAFVHQWINLAHPSGATFDITLRLGMPQIELSNGPTSVIATNNTGAVTRSGDSLRRLSLPAGFDQTRGTVAMEWELQEAAAAGGIIGELGDGTGNNRIFLARYSGGANDCQVVAAGVTQAGSTSTSQQQNSGVIYRTARAYQANDAARADSNGSLLYGAPQTIPAVSALGLGVSLATGAAQPNAWLRRWRYWPQRLTNNQLAQIAAGLA